jgi:hypothetical protein
MEMMVRMYAIIASSSWITSNLITTMNVPFACVAYLLSAPVPICTLSPEVNGVYRTVLVAVNLQMKFPSAALVVALFVLLPPCPPLLLRMRL